MSYGPSFPRSLSPSRHLCREDSQWREAEGPPVMQSDKFEFVINLKVAKTLGVTFSGNLLSLADEVIE
jgi:hypothetical protein